MKKQPSVLVIDDEQIVCDSCHRILSNEDYKVDSNTNPKEGYEKALKNDYDLILLDLNMSGLDGIQLLSKLRTDKPNIPVIIITGYPTKETKEESKRMGVNNYILKPFKPSEILGPVKSILLQSIHENLESSELAVGSKEVKEWKPSENTYWFYKNGWMQKGTNSTVRVGGQLPVLINETVKSIRLAEVNEVVYRGLPIAEVIYDKDIKIVVPSPVTGKVVEINEGMEKAAYLFEEEDRDKNWIAALMPNNKEEDLTFCETRNVMLLSKDDQDKSKYFKQITNLGYIAERTAKVEDVIKAVENLENKVVIIDGKSFGDKGPAMAEAINEKLKDAKIIVFNTTDNHVETSYRQNKIFYYAVDPISEKEIAGILYGAYCFNKDKEPIENTQTTFLPQTIKRIQITNRQSKKVVVLAYDNVIQFNKGIGYLLIQRLLDNAYPIEIVHTKEIGKVKDNASISHINEEKEKNDRIIILHKEDLNKIAGSILKTSEKYENSGCTDNIMEKIAIQPADIYSDELTFDINTIKALAEIIEQEMTKE